MTRLDVVLDEKNGDPGSPGCADLLDQVGALGRVHARGRLVQQQQAGLGGQRAGDLDQALRPVGQAGGRQVGLVRKPDGGQRLAWPCSREARSPRALMRQAETAGPQAGALVPVTTHEHVLEHAHVHVDAKVLERAGHAEARGVGRSRAWSRPCRRS